METIMKTVTKTQVVTETETKYVAFDGTVFAKRYECEDYEKEAVLKRKDVIVFDKLTNCLPFFYEENWAQNDYLYVMPTTEEAIKAIENIYEFNYGTTKLIPNQIYCFEMSDGWSSCIPVEELKDQVKSFFGYMNININFS